MSDHLDRLYELLPAVHRRRDAEQGEPLRALLRVVGEQVDVVEADIGQTYDNWFIETCEDWVVPYLGELVGYEPVHEAGDPGLGTIPAGRGRILVPRREVAGTIGYLRRKGTLALLEVLAAEVAGWPARAVELYRLLGSTQTVRHLRLDRSRLVDVRHGETLERLGGALDELAHIVDVRRVRSRHRPGRHNLPSVAVFVWRLRAYPITDAPAYAVEAAGPHCYTFSVLGNDAPLYTNPEPEVDASQIAGAANVPEPIRRRALVDRLAELYGPGASVAVRVGPARDLVPAERLVVADLSGWRYRPRRGTVAIDPELGRLAFPPGEVPRRGVAVSYHYGFSADLGGGEYLRPAARPAGCITRQPDAPPIEDTGCLRYPVGPDQPFERINDALDLWRQDRPAHAIVEVVGSGVYVEQLYIELGAGQRLELRAGPRSRPVLRLLDWQTSYPDALSVSGAEGSCFVLDGLLLTGRGMQVSGDLAGVVLRHVTLVPGWAIGADCEPHRPAEPSLQLVRTKACVVVEHSIIGSIQVDQDEVTGDPIPIRVSDSVVDATSAEREAVGAPGWPFAHVMLTVEHSTVVGLVQTHAMDLAENSIFWGSVQVARRQRGCMRFCFVPRPCHTPRRFNCQPDLVEERVRELVASGDLDMSEQERVMALERLRVRPKFSSLRYGRPTYCRLADACAPEITRGADDESEMGVFHELYQPQRAANLTARLEQHTPAAADIGIVYAS
jgi:hypothetical protein